MELKLFHLLSCPLASVPTLSVIKRLTVILLCLRLWGVNSLTWQPTEGECWDLMLGGQCPSQGGPPVSVDCENLDVKFMGPHRYWQSESGIVILDIIVHTATLLYCYTVMQTLNAFGRKNHKSKQDWVGVKWRLGVGGPVIITSKTPARVFIWFWAHLLVRIMNM